MILMILLIVLIVALLFSTKKLRHMGEDLGAALKSFRTGLSTDQPPVNQPDDDSDHSESR